MPHIAGFDRHLYGWKPDMPDHRDKMFRAPAIAVPPSASLRPQCPPIRDQYGWGSCTANASAEAMGFLYKKGGGEDPLFSRFFIYYFTRKFGGGDPAQDDGSSIRDAFRVMSKKGACREAVWEYTQSRFGKEPSEEAQQEALEHQALMYYRCTSLRTVQASIVQGFPVVFGFSVPENLNSAECAKTGIVKYPTSDEDFIGGHAVLAVAYNDSKQLVTFQNSWGLDWGDRGFGFLPYRFFAETLANDCWTLRRQEMP